ncbi:MAG: transcriptional regulator [Candidatus Marinimicrobia bacterium]|nr:transcriptional regulator [Candidatus Neomarinimicrobiota bacterium]
MTKNLVVTLIGKDEIGIVEKVTRIVLKYHGNITESKMARLGGEFAMLLQIRVDDNERKLLEMTIAGLEDQGFQVFYKETFDETPAKFKGWLPYEITITGADHEGIINQVTSRLAKNGMNVESIDTKITMAPMSGTALFNMNAIVMAPPKKTIQTWAEELDEVAAEMNVDIDIDNYRG